MESLATDDAAIDRRIAPRRNALGRERGWWVDELAGRRGGRRATR